MQDVGTAIETLKQHYLHLHTPTLVAVVWWPSVNGMSQWWGITSRCDRRFGQDFWRNGTRKLEWYPELVRTSLRLQHKLRGDSCQLRVRQHGLCKYTSAAMHFQIQWRSFGNYILWWITKRFKYACWLGTASIAVVSPSKIIFGRIRVAMFGQLSDRESPGLILLTFCCHDSLPLVGEIRLLMLLSAWLFDSVESSKSINTFWTFSVFANSVVVTWAGIGFGLLLVQRIKLTLSTLFLVLGPGPAPVSTVGEYVAREVELLESWRLPWLLVRWLIEERSCLSEELKRKLMRLNIFDKKFNVAIQRAPVLLHKIIPHFRASEGDSSVPESWCKFVSLSIDSLWTGAGVKMMVVLSRYAQAADFCCYLTCPPFSYLCF